MTIKANLTNMDHIANALTSAFNSKIIFSDPIVKEDVTVIPVAKIVYGLGGGVGTRANDSGEGGGGGFFAKPVGYIEIRNGTANFKAIRDPLTYAPVIMASGLAGYVLLRGLARLIKKT
ncbi:spore germination protein GerW family protein [Legionella maioricensis]|uniref:Sporulation protein YtfJ n=1 Tax=Legionella maioricensis TaxID=2896528 RepID=A0A9X2CYH7_9GAMM|nr:spore germination protein GerW family protein [Legionella maioricensis]MCL9683229.1 hypothetical protein [Legionella maioricensis]MCL9686073.1 hypothetical protein [Legionella maioricensis]